MKIAMCLLCVCKFYSLSQPFVRRCHRPSSSWAQNLIWLKLCGPVGTLAKNGSDDFFLFRFLILYGRDRGCFVKTDFGQFLHNGESQKLQIFTVDMSNESALHIIQVLTLTYFSRSQRSKFKFFRFQGVFRYSLT